MCSVKKLIFYAWLMNMMSTKGGDNEFKAWECLKRKLCILRFHFTKIPWKFKIKFLTVFSIENTMMSTKGGDNEFKAWECLKGKLRMSHILSCFFTKIPWKFKINFLTVFSIENTMYSVKNLIFYAWLMNMMSAKGGVTVEK